MSGSVVQGPWSAAPVRQGARGRSLGEWWERVGPQLRVSDGEHWFSAPVPEAKIAPGYPQPNRAPDPDRITAALDWRGMFGPEVDEALGVAEPMVDLWESGDIVPTGVEVRRLATLTGFPVHWFYRGPVPKIGSGWMCGEGGCRPLGVEDADGDACPHCGAAR